MGALLVAPATGYFLLRYPDWAVMYMMSGSELGYGSRLLIAVASGVGVGVSGLLGLVLLRRLPLAAYALAAIAAIGVGAICTWGADRLWRVGSFDSFHGSTRNLMPALSDAKLGIALLVAAASLLGVWGYALMMLRRRANTLRD